jgi:hypothetical protein
MRTHQPKVIMKSKLPLRNSAAVLLLLSSVCVASVRGGQLPIAPLPPAPPQTAGAIDPMTGLPVQPPPQWKDANWNDPDKVIANLRYDGLPISEVAKNLSEEFKNNFDIILPEDFGQGLSRNANNMDWNATVIHLRLQNVKASEIFNAMNLLFENDRIPLQWELKMNGSRRLALLRVQADPPVDTASHKPPVNRIYYVGDLIGDDQAAGMSTNTADLVKTLSEVWKMSFPESGNIQFHEKAQLVIVTGTDEEIRFMQETLEAMRTRFRVEYNRRHEADLKKQAAEIKAAKEAAKTNDGGGSK